MFTVKNICIAFGSVFVLSGLLGFIPNPIVSADGIFAVNTMHNLVHLVTGAAFLLGALVFEGKAELTLKIIAGAYAAVALLGFVTSGESLLGLIHINQADRWLHLGLAMALVAAAVVSSKSGLIPQRA